MKILLTFVFLFVLGGDVRANEMLAAEADFYPSGAKFTFEAKTNETGEFELEIPATFGQVTGWRTQQTLRHGWVPAALKNLDAEIKLARENFNAKNAKISSLQQTLALLKEPQQSADYFDELLEYIKKAQEINEQTNIELFELSTERNELKTKIGALEESFNSKMPNDPARAVKISGRGDKNSVVRVETFTNFASWGAQHTMKLDSKTGKIEATLAASASQKSGVDVDGVLRFHTNVPQQDNGLPELPPRIVDIRPPMPPAQARGKMEVLAMANDAYMPMMRAAPQMTVGLAAMTLNGKGKIPGNGVGEEILLGSYEINSKVSLMSVPEFGGTVYIVAETEPLSQPIVAGAGQFFIDGQAASSPYIRNYGEGEIAKLTFGTAPLVKAERKEIVSKSDTSWWGTSGKLNDGYTIEITNGMPSEQKIIVQDRIPVSANSKILVSGVKITPAPAEQDSENILTWEMRLKPGEIAKISVNYTLEFPASESLMFR